VAQRRLKVSKPALLCVVPPYSLGPPAGIAYLLAYAEQQGCSDFGFLDLRLGVPDAYAPTYAHTGVFGDAYVMDVPDLPLVLSLVQAVDSGKEPASNFSPVIEKYCRERGISASYLREYLVSLDKYFSRVTEALTGVRFVGCSVWTSNFLTTLLFAAHLKRLPQPPIIVGGGPQFTESHSSAALALRSRLFDYVATGEGEASLLDLYSRAASGAGTAAGVPGTLALNERGEVQRGPERPLLSPSEIPVPAFDQMPLLSYQEVGAPRELPYHLSRGCTDKCTFCSEWVFWRRFRPGDAEQTIAGIRELEKRYGAEYIAFTDSLVNGHPGRLRQLAEGMLRRRRRIAWGGFMRAEMDPETATLLRRSGFDVAFVGIESMSDETLALMNKRRTELHNIKALRAFLGAGVYVVAGVIPGFPGDSREAFIHTTDQLRDLQHEFRGRLRINVEPFIVSPGQPLFSRLGEMGLCGVPWDDEVLDIAPKYRDVTASLFCTVKGANQGIERMGRLHIAEAIESDEPTKTDPFMYKVAEPLNHSEFDFEHLTGGWFLARLKGPAAWIYALLLKQDEQEQLVEKSYANESLDLSAAPNLRRLLKRLESAHSLGPTRVPTLIAGGYGRKGAPNGVYQTAPYIVSRRGDWHVKGRLLVVDFVNTSWRLLPAWQGEVLKVLRRAPQSASSLQQQLARKGITRSLSRCARLLHDLAESGIVLASQLQPAQAKPLERVELQVKGILPSPRRRQILPIIREARAQGNGCSHSEFQEAPNPTQALPIEAG
jgi:hypothetical protein